MSLLSILVLITLRSIPTSPKSNVLSGTTGDWIFLLSRKTYLLLLMIHYVYRLSFFVQCYINYTCHFHNIYVVVHGVLLKSIFWLPVYWTYYWAKLFIVNFCTGGKNNLDVFSLLFVFSLPLKSCHYYCGIWNEPYTRGWVVSSSNAISRACDSKCCV